MEIIRGKIQSAQKVVVYGPEGIGKSTFAAQFPEPLFIDTEGSTKHMDVARLPRPSSWTMLLEEVRQVKETSSCCQTLVVDTADWAEQLCVSQICSRAKKTGIEGFGYGKGYVYAAEEFGKLLGALDEVIERGVNVVVTAHAKMRKFEQPDETGSYDRWEMKLTKNVAPLLKEWADMVLFANYKTIVVAVDEAGQRHKAQGGERRIYTTHHPCWDAKNRHGLEPELSMDYACIAACIPVGEPPAQPVERLSAPPSFDFLDEEEPPEPEAKLERISETQTEPAPLPSGIPKELTDLMEANQVAPEEIQWAVADRGYYPEGTPIENYDTQFVQGVLVDAWPQVFRMIQENRTIPFN